MSFGVKTRAFGTFVMTLGFCKMAEEHFGGGTSVTKVINYAAFSLANLSTLIYFVGCGFAEVKRGDNRFLGATVIGALVGGALLGIREYHSDYNSGNEDDGHTMRVIQEVIKGMMIGAAVFSVPFTL